MQFLLVFVSVISVATCASILAVVPTLSKSHYEMFEVLICELAKRGHKITSVTTFPQESPIENLNEISVKDTRKVFINNYPFNSFPNVPETFLDVTPKFFGYFSDIEKVLAVPGVRNIISSNSTYDLVIYEMFIDDLFLGFAHKFKAPVITFSSCYMFPWMSDRFAIPANPAYVPGFYSGGYSKIMTFYQRTCNTFYNIITRLFYYVLIEPKIDDLAKKYFGDDMPSVHQLAKNISLYFTNTHFTFYGAEPLPPQVVDVSGIHLKPPKPLQQVYVFTILCLLNKLMMLFLKC